MNKIKELIEDTLNWLRDTSYNHSAERREFAIARMQGHRNYMAGLTRFSPYLHLDEWEKHR